MKNNAAIIIAIAAVGISIWQGVENREFYRLSAKPYFVFYIDLSPTDPEVGIFLKNNGLGTGIIKEFKVYVDNKLMKDEYCGWLEALKLTNLQEAWVEVNSPTSSTKAPAIKEGEKLEMLVIKQSYLTKERFELFKKALERINIQIKYESMYGNKFSIDFKHNEKGKK